MSKTPYCFVRAEELSCTNSKKPQRSLQKFCSCGKAERNLSQTPGMWLQHIFFKMGTRSWLHFSASMHTAVSRAASFSPSFATYLTCGFNEVFTSLLTHSLFLLNGKLFVIWATQHLMQRSPFIRRKFYYWNILFNFMW